MKQILFIAILIVLSVAVKAQPWKYTPKVQADSMNVYTYFKLNNEVVKFISPTDDQYLVRKLVAGKHIWTNVTANSLGYDSIRFDTATGNLKGYRSGTTNAASTTSLDGRFTIIQTFHDSIAALRASIPDSVMQKPVYDPANVGGQIVNTTTSQSLSNKTLLLPSIANYSNANHNHSSTVQGGTISSDHVVEGTTNLFSPFSESSGNYILSSGKIGVGKIPSNEIDVLGTIKGTVLEGSSAFTLGGNMITSIQLGTSDNDKLPTKGWVSDQIVTAGGYTDEKAQDAVGTILDNGTTGDIVFTYDDPTPKISGEVENDSHNHTGTTISGLTTADFTSANVSQWTNDAGYNTGTGTIGYLPKFTGTGTFGDSRLMYLDNALISYNATRIASNDGIPSNTVAGWMSYSTPTFTTYIGDGTGYSYNLSIRNTGVDYPRITFLDNGNTGFGTVSPTAKVHIAAGTASASTAPIKLTSGVNLTTPEAGAVEYDGTNLYFTPSTSRKTISFSDHTHTGIYENPLTFSTGLSRVGNTISSTITQYTDALARGSISLTTTGSSGAATYNSITGELNIPQYSGGLGMTWPTGSGIPIVSGGNSWGTTIVNGTGFLKNNGAGSWTYDSNTYDNYVRWYISVNGASAYPVNSGETFDIQEGAGITVTKSNRTVTITATGGGGTMIYPGSGIPISTGSSWGTSIADNSSNWNTAYNDRLKWDGGGVGLVPATGRTSLGATTIGSNLFTLMNPSAVTYPQFNADNTVTALSSSGLRTAIGAGTVTSVGLTVPTGFTVTGSPITSSGTLAISMATGYVIPTTTQRDNWNTAYGWGNHAGLYVPIANDGKVKINGYSSYYDLSPVDFSTNMGSVIVSTSSTPTSGQSRPITSDGVYTALLGKQSTLNGTGFVKASGTTISYDNNSYALLNGSASQDFLTSTLILGSSWSSGWSLQGSGSTFSAFYNGSGKFTIASNGDVTANNFIGSSDRKLKQNIKPIGLNNAGKIELVQFQMKSDPNKLRYGVIAQDVEKVMPELVTTNEETGMKGVHYIDLLIAKIADLEERIKKLENAK